MSVTGRAMTLPTEAAPANSVPAAAVIRRGQALFGVTGRKAHVGGYVSLLLKASAQPVYCSGNYTTRVPERNAEYLV